MSRKTPPAAVRDTSATGSSPSQRSARERPAQNARAYRPGGFSGRIADVDLRLLRVFATVAEHGGFSAAERILGKSKSTISIDVAALEDRLGLTLCHRGRAGFSLTREGTAVLAASQDLFRDIDGFQQRISTVSGRLTGCLSLYLLDNILIHGETPLIDALALFSTRHPEVHLDVRSASAHDVELAVMNGTATAGVTLFPQEPGALPGGMLADPLFSEHSYLYCGARHPLFTVPDEEITRERLACARAIEVTDTGVAPQWEALRGALTFRARADNVDSRVLLILSGLYIGFLPELFARRMVDEGRLRRIDFGGLHLINHFHLLTRPTPEGGLLTSAFRAAVDAVRA